MEERPPGSGLERVNECTERWCLIGVEKTSYAGYWH